MLLVIDVGNTNLTLATIRDGALGDVRRAATPAAGSADELEVLLDGLLRITSATPGAQRGSLDTVTAIVLSSVVPTVTRNVEAVAGRRGLPLLVAGPGTVPVANRVDRPGDVGADRLVNTLAVARLHGTPAIVVDAGTATTFDCVGADGAFLGGAIAPGLGLGLDALADRTAALPRVELRAPDRAIGRDTVGAIQSGAVLGYQALVEGLVRRLREELADVTAIPAERVVVVLTGGFAAAPWARGLAGVDVVDPDLTLRGLAILHAEVAGGQPMPGLRR